MKNLAILFFILVNGLCAAEEQRTQNNLQSFYEALEKKKNEKNPKSQANESEIEDKIKRITKENLKNTGELTYGKNLPETKEKQGEIEKGKWDISRRLYKKEEIIHYPQFDLIEIGNSVFANVDRRTLELKINSLLSADVKRTEIDINTKALDAAIKTDGVVGTALLDSITTTSKFSTGHQQNQQDSTMLMNDSTSAQAKTFIRIKKGQFVSERVFVKDISPYEIRLAVK